MIDWNRINELRDEIGPDDFTEIAEMFLGEVREGIDALAKAEDMPAKEAAYHNLKGSALNLGFSTFAKLCQEGEAACANGNNPGFDQKLISETFDQSLAQFQNNFR